MIDYYKILGVPRNAGNSEIKSAFRQLAKQYHPDKNPNGKEFFERVLKAYETLSNNQHKIAYDYKLKSFENKDSTSRQTESGVKNWRFDEKELKRRQYYNEHIRKYAKETASYNAKAREKRAYNEYKYILFATPIAVLLFVMIMKLASPTIQRHKNSGEVRSSSVSELRPGDSPYNFVFGSPHFDTVHNKKLVIKNMTGLDAIICIFSNNDFIRSFFIQGGFSAEVAQLPKTALDIRYCCGQDFNYRLKLKEVNIMGGFTRKAAYYKSLSSLLAGDNAELSLLPGINENFVKTGPKEFFKTPQ